MATYGQMLAELQLTVMAKLLSADVGLLLNQAQRDEVEAGWPWGFLYSNFVLNSAAPQSAGTISVNQGSPIVTGVGTSFADPGNSQSLISFGSANGVSIPIKSFDSSTQVTLTANWMGASLSGSSYSIKTPVYSVVGFQEVYNIRQINDLVKISREEINRSDPARLSTGGSPSTYWADAGWDSSGNCQVELWEVPAAVLPYVVEGKLAVATMVNNSDLPQIPSTVIVNKAMMKCALALYASNGDARYMQLATKYEAWYADALEKAKHADSRRQQQIQMASPGLAIGLDIYATHDVVLIGPGDT